ncbi:MAG: AMP-binding protein [Bacteroides sp.]|nr:AMP-binding protein [Bacteroidales bacterium]MCI6680591.1 AMP-binding protein [Bacteroides sp.]MDD7490658.1 AMP-binding protein [Bacteroides sp.]MDY5890826.1 AMP-binding protein [Candidatus Cryptobacteroides sp.]
MEKKRPTIIDFVEQYTAKYGDETFLREKVDGVWKETSFNTTREEAHILAAGFMSMGLEKGDKVALISEGRNYWIFSELGILYAGAVNVPLSFKLESDTDLTFRINHSDARFVIASQTQIDKIRRVIDRCPKVEKVIVMDPIELKDGEIYIGDIMAAGKEYLKEHQDLLLERMASVGPDDYANISYTSGTTADPKGILLTHRNYTANVDQALSVISIDRGDVMLIILPLDHCFAHVAGFYVMMKCGGSIATVPCGKSTVSLLKNIPTAIKEVRPHVLLSVPTLSRNFKKSFDSAIKKSGSFVEKLYEFGIKNAETYNREYYNAGKPCWKMWWRKPINAVIDKLVFSKVREGFGGRIKFFVGGGALLDIELQRYYCAIGMPVFQGYGLSEATPVICSNSMGHARFGSSGRVVKPMDIKICDEDGKEIPNGETGEIVIRGENVMAGYWKNPEATAKTIVDGWLHTGDRGYICKEDPEYLYVTGRFKSLLIASDGEKYSPEGYEDSLADGSKFIETSMLYNNQSPYTVVLVIPNKTLLAEEVKKAGLDPGSLEGKKAQLAIIKEEVDAYRPGGRRAGMFPERWLPASVIVGDTPFTEQNGMLNTTMKMVRGKVEKFYADRIEYAMTVEGKDIMNQKNIDSL